MAGLVWPLIATDEATPAFLRVAAAADKTATSTARATKSIGGMAAGMGKAGKTLTHGLTVPLLALGGVAVDQAAKWQRSMTLIQTAGGETLKKATALSKGLENTAKQTGTSLGDLGEGIYTVAKAGARKWSATDQLNIMKAASEGAKAENVDLGTAVNALTSVMAGYGVKAKNAVAVENQLIRASGLSKTSFQEFAGSLSNVVPLASALHISFAQVGGAIATMTQHGESAQRSTENLNNLIRSLAGQNNVASGAMQQLGINVVNLEKNLGKRGLTGTLGIVEKAIENSSKGGMVAVGAFKNAQTATQDLGTALAKMPPYLANISKQFASGKMSYSDYRTAVRSLGGEQYTMGQQFISLVSNAKGFSQALRSGNPLVQTAATQLQKMLGGATGMNAALMLGGNSRKTFISDTANIAKVAKNAGADVLGWGKTQDTLAVKMDKAKESLQVLAVEVGTALIPAVSKIVGWIQQGVHWFENLSGTGKKIVGWSLVVLAAMGPVLSIGAKLTLLGGAFTRFTTTVGTSIARMVGATETTQTRVATVMRGVSSTIGGAVAGLTASYLTPNSGGGMLASILLGTAGGWALGGPVGAAVGGISAAVSKGITLWRNHASAAQTAVAAEIKGMGDLTGAIDAGNGALRQSVRIQADRALGVRQAGQPSALDLAESLHVPLQKIVNATLGKKSALKAITVPINALTSQGRTVLNRPGFNTSDILGVQTAAALHEGELTKGQASQISGIQSQIRNYEKLYTLVTGLSLNIAGQKKLYDQVNRAVNSTRNATGGFANQLATLGKHTSIAENNEGQLNTSLNQSTVAGRHNQDMLTKLAVAAKNDADHTLAAAVVHGKTLPQALKLAGAKLADNAAAFTKTATAAGFSKKRVGEIISTYGQIPRQEITEILKKGVLPADIQKIIDKLNQIPKYKSVTIGIDAINVGKGSSTYNSQVPHAAGGPVRDGMFTVGERGWELGEKRGSSVRIFSNAQSRAMTGWNRVPGFASGSTPNTGTATTSAIGRIGEGPSSPIDLSSVGIFRVWAQIRAARSTLAKDVADGLNASSAAKFRAQIHHLVTVANREFGKLQVKIRTTDLNALTKALKGTAPDTRSAFGQLFTDLRHADAPGGVLSALKRTEGVLIANQQSLASANARLSTMQQYRTGVRSTLAGAFDPTQFGSIQDLGIGLGTATGTNNSYARELRKLRGESAAGSPLRKFINTLAASGQTATLQTLAGASRSQLRNIAKDVGAYDKSLSAGSNAATTAKFGESVARQEKVVNKLVDSQHEINESLHHVVQVVAHIASTGPTKAQDKRLEHLVSEMKRHVDSARRSGSS